MNNYNDLDMFFGKLMVYKDNEFRVLMDKATFIYNGEEDYFLLLDNIMIGYFDDLKKGNDKALGGLEEAYEKRKFFVTPKKEEGYVFVDESSLVKLGDEKGIQR